MPGSTRDRTAATLFGLVAALLFVLAAEDASVAAAAMGAVLVVAALASLRGYPIDREW